MSTFVMHPNDKEGHLDLAIRVKDGAIVLTDRTSHRFVFDLADPNGPKKVSTYIQLGNAGGSRDRWTIIDKDGNAFVDVDQRYWDRDDFEQLAIAAGLPLEPELGEAETLESPERRPDFVDLSDARGGRIKWLAIGLGVPVLLVFAIQRLLSDSPWLWLMLFVGLGFLLTLDDIRDALEVQRNRPYLPVDEGGLGLAAGQPPRPLTSNGRSGSGRCL
jgi:hypothetical protein